MADKMSTWTPIANLHNGSNGSGAQSDNTEVFVNDVSSGSETGGEFEGAVIGEKGNPPPPPTMSSRPEGAEPPPMATTGSSENLGSNIISTNGGPSSTAPAGVSLPTKRVRKPRRRKNPVAFVDPIADFLTELYGPGPASSTGDDGHVPEVSRAQEKLIVEMEKENNKTPAPLPSTSKLVDKSNKRRAPRSPGSGGEGPSSDRPVMVEKRARRSLTMSSPLSADKGNRKSSSSGTDSDDEDSDDEVPVTPRRRCSTKKRTVISSDSEGAPPTTEKSEKKKPRILKKGLRRYTEKAKTDKEIALERLQKKMEARKVKQAEKKAKAPSEPRRDEEAKEESGDESGESNCDSDGSESGSGSSPCPVVPDDEVSLSAASDSSVTTAAETDEEPDLGSGSEGEKELVKEEPEDEEEKSDRTSSSSEDEAPDDGQNDIRCLLCKELGSGYFEGRAEQGSTSWCKCGECKIFSDDVGNYDLICCKEMKTVRAFLREELDDDVCITKHPRFKVDVLENGGYARAISKHYSFGLRTGGGAAAYYEYSCANRKHSDRMYELAKKNFQKSGREGKYWKSLSSFKYWIFDRLNYQEGQTMVIPACVLSKVHQFLNVPRPFHRPFKTITKCQGGLHCGFTFDDTPATYGVPV